MSAQHPDPEHDSIFQRFEQLEKLLTGLYYKIGLDRFPTEKQGMLEDARKIVALLRAQVLK